MVDAIVERFDLKWWPQQYFMCTTASKLRPGNSDMMSPSQIYAETMDFGRRCHSFKLWNKKVSNFETSLIHKYD